MVNAIMASTNNKRSAETLHPKEFNGFARENARLRQMLIEENFPIASQQRPPIVQRDPVVQCPPSIQEIRELLEDESTSGNGTDLSSTERELLFNLKHKKIKLDEESQTARKNDQLLKQVVVTYPPEGAEYALVLGRDFQRLNVQCPFNATLIRFGLLYIINEKLPESMRNSIVLFDQLYGTIDLYQKMPKGDRKMFRDAHPLGDKNFLVFLCKVDVPSGCSVSSEDGERGEDEEDDEEEDDQVHWYLAIVTDIKDFQGPPSKQSCITSTITYLDSNRELGSAHYKQVIAGVRSYLHDVYVDQHGADIHLRLSHRSPTLPQHAFYYDCGLYVLLYFEAFFKKTLFRSRILAQQPIGKVRLSARKVDSSYFRYLWRCTLFDYLHPEVTSTDLLRELQWSETMIDKIALTKNHAQ